MTNPFEREHSVEKEAILARAPALKAFLDGDLAKALECLSPLDNELKQKVGQEWASLTVTPLTVIVHHLGFFEPHLSQNEKVGLIKLLQLLGYELSNAENVKLFTGDITTKAIDFDWINHQELDQDPMKPIGVIVGTLLSGAWLKNFDTPDVPPAFNDFSKYF